MLKKVQERRPGTGTMPGRRKWLMYVVAILVFCVAITRPAQAQECSGPGDPICNDNNPCTLDECLGGALGGTCFNSSNCPDDGLFCTGIEVCCIAPGGCDGTPFGSCEPATPIDCGEGQICSNDLPGCVACEVDLDCDDGNDCTDDVCSFDEAGAICEHTPRSGQSCNDGDPCTDSDTCTGTECIGQDVVCDDGNNCTFGVCNLVNGVCDFFPFGNGFGCSDEDACTAIDACLDGVCVGGPVDGCVDLELRAPAGPFHVGDILDIELHAIPDGSCPPPAPGSGCPVGTQPINSISAVFTWDPAFFELADPAETGVPNPQDPCGDPDPCVDGCGESGKYDWGTSLYPNDCLGDCINSPGTGLPANDGNAVYLSFASLCEDPGPVPPACAPAAGLMVTNLKFKAIAVTAGPTAIALEDCILQTRTKIVGGSTGSDVMGSLGAPLLLEVQCLSDDDCPLGPCVNGECVTCPTPLVEVIGSRYLAVTPSEDVPEVAIRVSGAQSSDVDCVSGWVSTSGVMRADPVYQPPGPAGWDTIFVFGEKLVGGGTYDVYADCNPSSPGDDQSVPVSVTMWRWADTDGNTIVNIIDAVKALDAFSGLFHTIPCETDGGCFLVPPAFFCDQEVGLCLWTTRQNTDIISEVGCTPNGVVNIFDVLNILDGFSGLPDPCLVSCP